MSHLTTIQAQTRDGAALRDASPRTGRRTDRACRGPRLRREQAQGRPRKRHGEASAIAASRGAAFPRGSALRLPLSPSPCPVRSARTWRSPCPGSICFPGHHNGRSASACLRHPPFALPNARLVDPPYEESFLMLVIVKHMPAVAARGEVTGNTDQAIAVRVHRPGVAVCTVRIPWQGNRPGMV